MNNNESIQNVEIYLDYATIPSINYFLYFAENAQDTTSIRLFGLGRFQIPESIISAYPKGIIRYAPVSVENQEEFNQEFFSILSEIEGKVKINFHLNLFHGFKMFAYLFSTFRFFMHKIDIISITFYDDGAEGITTLYKLANNKNLEYEIDIYKNHLESFFSDFVNNIINGYDIFSGNLEVIRYLLSNVLPVKYVIVGKNYLDSSDDLLPLRKELANIYEEMDLGRFQTFSDEQKKIVLSILGLPENIQHIVDELNHSNCFVFIGTTCFSGDTNSLNQAHLYFIQQFLDKSSPFYIGDDVKLFYKGHPHAKEINRNVKTHFSEITFLNENIPFEILYLLGFNPKYIGGFASTSYLFLPKDKIRHTIFVVEEPGREKAYAHQMQYELSRLMSELGYISRDKIIYYQDSNIY